MEPETMLTPREKSSLPEAQTSQRRFEPMMLYHTGQQAQHSRDWAIPATFLEVEKQHSYGIVHSKYTLITLCIEVCEQKLTMKHYKYS